MIRVSILYPNTPGHRFDFEHYLNVHMPEAERRLGAALKGMSVERGLTGTAPDLPPAYTAMCHLLFDSVDAFMAEGRRVLIERELRAAGSEISRRLGNVVVVLYVLDLAWVVLALANSNSKA